MKRNNGGHLQLRGKTLFRANLGDADVDCCDEIVRRL